MDIRTIFQVKNVYHRIAIVRIIYCRGRFQFKSTCAEIR